MKALLSLTTALFTVSTLCAQTLTEEEVRKIADTGSESEIVMQTSTLTQAPYFSGKRLLD